MAESRQEQANTANVSPPSSVASNIQTTIAQGSQVLICGWHHLTVVLGLLFDGSIVFFSGGLPYLYYRLVHPKFPHDIELGNTPCPWNATDLNLNLKELWGNKLPQVHHVWKTHRLIVGVILAPMFPLISISPLPKCSWVYNFAILCLVYGSITFTTCVIHGLYFHNVDTFDLPTLWYLTLGRRFFRRDILHFYVTLSLPTVWFAGFVASFAMTILMIMVVVQDLHDTLEVDSSTSLALCHNNLRFLLVAVPLVFITAVIGSVRSIKHALNGLQGSAQ